MKSNRRKWIVNITKRLESSISVHYQYTSHGCLKENGWNVLKWEPEGLKHECRGSTASGHWKLKDKMEEMLAQNLPALFLLCQNPPLNISMLLKNEMNYWDLKMYVYLETFSFSILLCVGQPKHLSYTKLCLSCYWILWSWDT